MAYASLGLGEFNDWSRTSHPLKRHEDGSFATMMWLEAGVQYRFRYLLDGDHWKNEPGADGFVPNAFGSEDSIITV